MKNDYGAKRRFPRGSKVVVEGIVEGYCSSKNYVRVRINDHVCGMNLCQVTIHQAGLSKPTKAKGPNHV